MQIKCQITTKIRLREKKQNEAKFTHQLFICCGFNDAIKCSGSGTIDHLVIIVGIFTSFWRVYSLTIGWISVNTEGILYLPWMLCNLSNLFFFSCQEPLKWWKLHHIQPFDKIMSQGVAICTNVIHYIIIFKLLSLLQEKIVLEFLILRYIWSTSTLFHSIWRISSAKGRMVMEHIALSACDV